MMFSQFIHSLQAITIYTLVVDHVSFNHYIMYDRLML